MVQGLNALHDVLNEFPEAIDQDLFDDVLSGIQNKLSQMGTTPGYEPIELKLDLESDKTREPGKPRMPRSRSSKFAGTEDGLPFEEA